MVHLYQAGGLQREAYVAPLSRDGLVKLADYNTGHLHIICRLRQNGTEMLKWCAKARYSRI